MLIGRQMYQKRANGKNVAWRVLVDWWKKLHQAIDARLQNLESIVAHVRHYSGCTAFAALCK